MSDLQDKGWNAFARVLEEILLSHGKDWNWLASSGVTSPQTCMRLQQSLRKPVSFPVLDAKEQADLILILGLKKPERAYLQAALLTTELERMLCDYLTPEGVFLASDSLLPLLLEAVREGRIKRGSDDETRENAEQDYVWDEIQHDMDVALLMLEASSFASSGTRVRKIGEAQASFQDVLHRLNEMDTFSRSLPLWRNYHEKVRHNIARCIEILENLE